MTGRQIILITLTFYCLSMRSQVTQAERDSVKKENDAFRKEYSDHFKATIKDSVVFTGQLIDFDFGATCGQDRGSGIFIFQVTNTIQKNFPDTVAVIIQCARNSRYEKLLVRHEEYRIKVTPDKLKYWADIIWEPYEKTKRYFLLHGDLTKVH